MSKSGLELGISGLESNAIAEQRGPEIPPEVLNLTSTLTFSCEYYKYPEVNSHTRNTLLGSV